MGIEESYAANNVLPIFLPPHSSNQLQPYDLCVFGPAKLGAAKMNQAICHVQTIHIAKLIDAFHSAPNAWNIIGAFRDGGIIFRHAKSSNHSYPDVATTGHQLGCSPGLQYVPGCIKDTFICHIAILLSDLDLLLQQDQGHIQPRRRNRGELSVARRKSAKVMRSRNCRLADNGSLKSSDTSVFGFLSILRFLQLRDESDRRIDESFDCRRIKAPSLFLRSPFKIIVTYSMSSS
jgi:hypothetical protein